MSTRSWIRKLFTRTPRTVRKAPSRIRPRLEALEDRLAPATLTVNSLSDDTAGAALTLRAAILILNNGNLTSNITMPGQAARALTAAEKAQADTTSPFGTKDTIQFDGSLAGGTIKLALDGDDTFGPSALYVTSQITIKGMDPSGNAIPITITRDATAAPERLRLFDVAKTDSLTLQDLTLSGGLAQGGSAGKGGGGAGLGGAIVNQGTLTLLQDTLTGNQAEGGRTVAQGNYGGGGLGGNAGHNYLNGGPPNGGGNGGGNGGFGGGGGNVGGNGGFGGGGGGVNITGGTGGTGGFGGGGGDGFDGGGPGGFGGGGGASGYDGTGGGGAGLGGAVFNYGGTVYVADSTLANNSAQGGSSSGGGSNGKGYGGAVFNLNGTVQVNNSTLASNTAPDGGGAIFNLGSGGEATQSGPALVVQAAAVTLNNSILADSTSSSDFFSQTVKDAGSAVGTVSLSGGTNLIQTNPASGSGGFTGTTTLTGDPLLSPLGNHGGPTQTMALLPGSPAIGGVTANTSGTPVTDQRSFTRNTTAATDIGAFEVQPTDSTVALTASPGPSVYGQAVTLTAGVSLTLSGTKATAGTVTFLDGSTVLQSGVAVNASGQATCSTTALTAGTHTLLAVYSGATGFLPSAGALSQVVNPLAVTLSGSRPYDGTPTAAAGILSITNRVGSDQVTLSGSATLAGAGAGAQAILSFAGLTLGGTAKANYTLTGASGTVTINPLAVTLSGSRPYDGTPTAAAGILSITNRVGSDQVTLSGSATLAGAGAAAQAITSFAGLTLGGTAKANYTLTGASGTVTINPLAVTLGGSRIYDSTATAAAGILSITNLVGGDQVTLSGSATLAGAGPGAEAILSFAGLSLGGTAKANYTLTGASGSVTILSYADATTYLQTGKGFGVDTAGLASGLQSSLDTQLQAAIAYFNAGDTADGVSELGAFINHVSAQRGKGIANTSLADTWIAAAQQIIDAVG
jgi:hypothetical protein